MKTLSEKSEFNSELEQIEERYQKRKENQSQRLYSPLDPYVLMVNQERERAIHRWMNATSIGQNRNQATLLEIGCGAGGNLLRFLQWGFQAENLCGNDLLPDRIDDARELLPENIQLIAGDAFTTEFPEKEYDVVCLFTVFSSILDNDFQEQLANHVWSLVKPGGGVLWCDFIYNNPKNKDVQGVPVRRVKELFPKAKMSYERVHLAPPIGRRVSRIHPFLYSTLNSLPFLRSHILCWLEKESEK